MSVTINKTYTITFASKEDKVKSIGHLFRYNFGFKGTAENIIVVESDAYNALKKLGIPPD